MPENKNKLHNHPGMEKELNVPEGHVIVDRKLFDEITRPPEGSKTTITKQIADELFRNGLGDKAKRLVLELKDGRDGGGWCKQAVIDIIKKELDRLPAK